MAIKQCKKDRIIDAVTDIRIAQGVVVLSRKMGFDESYKQSYNVVSRQMKIQNSCRFVY